MLRKCRGDWGVQGIALDFEFLQCRCLLHKTEQHCALIFVLRFLMILRALFDKGFQSRQRLRLYAREEINHLEIPQLEMSDIRPVP